MGRNISDPLSSKTVTSVPLGGYADVFSSGDAYKAVGSIIKRSSYAEMSAAFPRNSAYTALAQSMPASDLWNGIAYGNGTFVAVGGSIGTYAATSVDGINWVQRAMPVNIAWAGIAFGAGLFVAVAKTAGGGQTQISATSPDGITWTQRVMPLQGWGSIAYSTSLGRFVAVSGWTNGSNLYLSATSTDGISWTQGTLPLNSGWLVAAGTDRFVAISHNTATAATSTNGVTWVNVVLPLSGLWRSITYAAGLFVAVGDAVALTSPDGVNWTQRVLPFPNPDARAVGYGDGVFLAASGNTNYLATSADAITWTQRKSPLGGGINHIAFGGGTFACLGYTSSSSVIAATVYAENNTDSDYMYISGTAGKCVRVR